MRCWSIFLALALISLSAGCGTGKGASSYLYEAGVDEPRLLDSEIRMETDRYLRGGPGPDIRSIRCHEGRIWASYRSPARKQEGEAEIPLEEYSRIWNEVMESAGWTASPEAPDATGGYYHFIRFRLGTRVGETSAQDRANFLGMGTQDIRNRLRLANEITDLVAKYVVDVGPIVNPVLDGEAADRWKERFDRYLLDLRLILDAIDPQQFEAAVDRLAGTERIFVAGLGRTGAVMRAFAARLAQAARRVHVVLEPGCPDFAPGDVVVLGSGSGATRTMTAVAQEARSRGATILLITGNMLSPLNREADQTLYLPPTLSGAIEGTDSIQPGRTAFEQASLLALDALAEGVAERRSGAADPPG